MLALLVPKGLCPICVAASGGILSSLGLSFLADGEIVRWVLAGALLVGLIGLGLATRSHRRWWILALGAVGAITLYLGWLFETKLVLYGGMGLLFAASVCNLWRRRVASPLVQLRIRKGENYGEAKG
jgi:hypothetical protein